MARRLFLVEFDPFELNKDLKFHNIAIADEFNIIETFIQAADNRLIQLLSSSRIYREKTDSTDRRWAKGEFIVKSYGWKLEKSSPRVEISESEYYEILLKTPNAAVERKVRTVFHAFGRRYSLEVNFERNYSVIQVDYDGDYSLAHDELFSGFRSVDVVGELYMSLEETFCRLYLRGNQQQRVEDSASFDIETRNLAAARRKQ